MNLKNYLVGTGLLASAVLVSIPIGDAMFRGLLGKTKVENTRVTFVEDYSISNDLGMHFSGRVINVKV